MLFVLRVCNVCIVVASATAVDDPVSARRVGQASIGLSIAGIIISVLAIIIVLAVEFSDRPSSSSTWCLSYEHEYAGKCYNHREYLNYYDSCWGVKDGNYCYYN